MGSSNPISSAAKSVVGQTKSMASRGWSPIDGALNSTGRFAATNDPTGMSRIAVEGAQDANSSLRVNNGRRAIGYGVGALAALGGNPTILSAQIGYDLGTRTRNDMREQAAGEADKQIAAAAAAERRAQSAAVKELDPLTLERRRRAAVATNQGRSGTILTSGTSLGSADVARKTLLGM
jgi:hypothetical protein